MEKTIKRSFNVFLFGYYGFNNYGDEVLLRSSLKLLKDYNIGEVFLLYPKIGSRKIGGIKVTHVKRDSIFSIIKAISKSNIVIGGGGGIFQNETSNRSFMYYDFLVSFSMLMKKITILAGHGLGRIRGKYFFWRMKRILSNKYCFGIFRDEISYRYAHKICKNHSRGTDLAYGFLNKKENTKSIEGRLGLILKRNWENIENIIPCLKAQGIKEILLIVTYPDEEIKIISKLEKKLSPHFAVSVKMGEVNEVTDAISSCSLIITERLHGAIAASFYNVPFLASDSYKIRAFFRDFKEYNSYFKEKNSTEIIYGISMNKKNDFQKYNSIFVQNNINKFENMSLALKESLM